MVDKLDIGNEMLQFDKKNRDFYDSLTEEEQRKFNPYLMIRWGAMVEGSRDLQEYYLLSANDKLNKNYFDISSTNHKKLLWLLATTVSPGMGKQRHNWLSASKKDSSNNKTEKFLRELYPTAKNDEIQLMARLNDKKELKQLARDHGYTDEQIKKFL
jgi:hypothetical protein